MARGFSPQKRHVISMAQAASPLLQCDRGASMTDRRRAPRYQLCRSTKTEINLLQDVLIQSAVGDDVVVLAATYPAPCDRLILQMAGPNGEVTSLTADLVATTPILHSSLVQFRVAL